MTDKKASEENPAANVADADFWAGVKGGLDVRFSFAQVKTWIKGWITKADVGLGNVNNTADASKPISTATQNALDLKADISSLGTAAAADTTDFATAAQGGLADTAVQPGSLGTLAAKNKADVPGDLNVTGTPDGSKFLRDDGSWHGIPGGGDMLAANNLSDLDDAATARNNLGLSDTLPTTQVFTSGSGTYTTPANCLWIEVELVGGGGGGGGGGSSPGNGGAGGNTTFGSLTGNGGDGTITGFSAGNGGSASGGYVNFSGARGQNGSGLTRIAGGNGGPSFFGLAGWGGAPGGGPGVAASANSGSGGGGGGCHDTINSGGGGGGGGYVRAIINNPSATYSYAVGAGGSAGAAGGGSGGAGAAGGSGVIIVTEHYDN